MVMSKDLQTTQHEIVPSQLSQAINLSLTIGEVSKMMKYNEEVFTTIAGIIAQHVRYVVLFYKSMRSCGNRPEEGTLGAQDEDTTFFLRLIVDILQKIHEVAQKAASRNAVMGWIRTGSDVKKIYDYKLTLESRFGSFKILSNTYLEGIVRRAIDS